MKNREDQTQKSANRLIIDLFVEKGAISQNRTLAYEEITVPVSDKVKKIMLNHLLQDQLIFQKEDGTMWFDKRKWDEIVKKLSRKYMAILIAPIFIVATLCYILSII